MLQMQAFDYFWRYIYSVCVLVSTCALYIIWSFVSCAELDFCDVAIPTGSEIYACFSALMFNIFPRLN